MNHKNFPTSHIHSCTADSIATGSIKPVKNPKPWFFLKQLPKQTMSPNLHPEKGPFAQRKVCLREIKKIPQNWQVCNIPQFI